MGPEAGTLEDRFGRRFRYLRLSVTEACNFRCAYCLPHGYRKQAPHDFLSVAEIGRLARAFAEAGVGKVRLTGGEPSVRKDLTEIIAAVAGTSGVAKTALTTNGWNLARKAVAWRAAGLTHLNVSLDSLDEDTFRAVTGNVQHADILMGIDLALGLDFAAVKLNAVLLRETAGEGFGRFADFVRERPVTVRFIELMRTADNAAYFAANHLPGRVLRDWLSERGWTPAPRPADGGPAIEFEHPDHAGRLGLIAPYAPGFCESCNRLRVTARGKLRLCLFGDGGIGLRDLLRADRDRLELRERIRNALGAKTVGHRLAFADPGDARNLAQMGG
ncbi:MAG TPA: GTP 3',8-cyclase MoaA [Caulobacteraceae bacterium]|jgi:cyclic pyranopterin phosphate synthase